VLIPEISVSTIEGIHREFNKNYMKYIDKKILDWSRANPSLLTAIKAFVDVQTSLYQKEKRTDKEFYVALFASLIAFVDTINAQMEINQIKEQWEN
jgi:hypothetical protein